MVRENAKASVARRSSVSGLLKKVLVVVGVAWIFQGHRLTSRSGGEGALFRPNMLLESIRLGPPRQGFLLFRLDSLQLPHNPRIADGEAYLLAAQRQRMYERQRFQLD